jgi:hypothetical protein
VPLVSDSSDDPADTTLELRELAIRAEALAQAIGEAEIRLRAGAEGATGRAAWRLDEAAGAARGVARELLAASADLSLGPGGSICNVNWGACPDHGKTLAGTAGRSWCRHPGCGRSWHYDRAALPCAEPVAFCVRTRPGDDGVLVCKGHAIAALEQQADAVLTPIPQRGADDDEGV